jgi:mono/diheme cytochrome c family protein
LAVKTAAYALILAVAGAAMILSAQDTKAKTAAKPAAKTSETGNAQRGRRLFAKDGCYQCHGLEGQGSLLSGPRLGPNPIPYEAILVYIRKPSGVMPPYTEKALPDRDVLDIYAFLASLPPPHDAKTIPGLNK